MWCNVMRLNILNLWWYSKLQFSIARNFKSMITGKMLCMMCLCIHMCVVLLWCVRVCIHTYSGVA